MHQLLTQPSLFSIIFVFLFIILILAIWTDKLENEDIPDLVGSYEPKVMVPSIFEPSEDFCRWWTPEELEHCAEIEKMATPEGHHSFETFENFIVTSISHWSPKDKFIIAHSEITCDCKRNLKDVVFNGKIITSLCNDCDSQAIWDFWISPTSDWVQVNNSPWTRVG